MEGGVTFTLSTEGIDPGAQLSQIDSGDDIVHTKHWLFNEIPVARFHLTPPVRGPVIPLPLDSIGVAKFQDKHCNPFTIVNLARHHDRRSLL